MEAPWLQSLHQSHRVNVCLAITQQMYVATVSQGLPHNHAVLFRGFSDLSAISCYMDQRSELFQSVVQAPCELLWAFPLTNEVYRFPQPEVRVLTHFQDQVAVQAWQGLKDRERMGFAGLPPDSFADAEITQENHDIDAFSPQSLTQVSRHFAVVFFHPTVVDHTRFLNKTAIGNTRKTHESLLQPDIQPQRWMHVLQPTGEWVTRRMNISLPSP